MNRTAFEGVRSMRTPSLPSFGVDTLPMDLEGPGRDVQVGRQSPYPEEFRKDAVALHRVAGGKRTYAAVAAELGITGETLRMWVRKDTDRGAQYTATASSDICRRHGIRRSMGHAGSSYDNALAEPFFQGLKRELLHGQARTSKAKARLKLFRRLAYHNRRRRGSALGYPTPIEFEQRLITSPTLSLAA
jgi:hypothetical protein